MTKKITEEKIFEDLLISKHIYLDEIVSIEKVDDEVEVFDINIKNNLPYFIANNIISHNSMYPNIFRTFNISPDTVLKEKNDDCIVMPNGSYFSKKEGLIPKILDKLTKLRLKYKAEQKILENKGLKDEALIKEFEQTAVKVVILSIYGISGAVFSRFFDINVANAITEMGQHLIKTISRNLTKYGYGVVTGDTDSIMFQIHREEDRTAVENIINNTINEVVKNTHTEKEHTLAMEHEKTLSKFIVLAKKKYIGRCVMKDGKQCDELYYKGIELVKSSELRITKDMLREISNAILYQNAGVDDCVKIINKYKNKILNKDIKDVDEITIVKKVGKMPEQYKNLPVHVELAAKRKEQGDFFYTSMKVPFIVISNNPLKITHRDDYKGEFDEKYYWENQIYGPTYRLLKAVWPLMSWEMYQEGSKEIQKRL